MSGLFGGSKKVKVKRKIPKPTQEEKDLLKRLISFAEDKENYGIYNPLEEALKQPYQTMNSTYGRALMEVILGGYPMPPGVIWMQRFAAQPWVWGFPGQRMRRSRTMQDIYRIQAQRGEPTIWEKIANYGQALEDVDNIMAEVEGMNYGF